MHRHESRNSGDRFVFVRNHEHDWEWLRIDSNGYVVEPSACSFKDHADAIADAVLHGFTPGE